MSWEDDLIMTGVRSFDVKAYDNSTSGYVDLGWGDDPRVTSQIAPVLATLGPALNLPAGLPYLHGNIDAVSNNAQLPCQGLVNGFLVQDMIGTTFAHEGRMPPLVFDNRLDYQYPNPNYVSPTNYTQQYGTVNGVNYTTYSSNLGDNNNGVDRLRRVWDSWLNRVHPGAGQRRVFQSEQ